MTASGYVRAVIRSSATWVQGAGTLTLWRRGAARLPLRSETKLRMCGEEARGCNYLLLLEERAVSGTA